MLEAAFVPIARIVYSIVDLVVSQACRPDERADADVSLLGADDLVVSQACRADELSLKKKLFSMSSKTQVSLT